MMRHIGGSLPGPIPARSGGAADTAAQPPANGVVEMPTAKQPQEEQQEVLDRVKEYYGEVLTSRDDLKAAACLTAGSLPPLVRQALAKVPNEIKDKFYGCGSPLPLGIEGLCVLDLGSGSGRDCYVCAALVGEQGSVTGVDMTPALLEVARRHAADYCTQTLGYAQPNMRFVEGRIEDLDQAGIQDDSVDLVISNCVVNLSPDKASVLREAYRVLAPGGEMHFSDVYCDRRLPEEVRRHPVLLGECLGGTLYIQDFVELCRQAGFVDPRVLSISEIVARDEALSPCMRELQQLLGGARFFSITYRLFKLPGALEAGSQDYGQACKYKGTIPGHKSSYALDQHNTFQAGKWYEVSGNTAAMVGDSWLGKHFEVVGDRSTHYGAFARGSMADAPAVGAATVPLTMPCSTSGTCH
ncbi:hypothetical protein ABPG75_007397 [Micractinium tetrahymenae]